MSSGFQKRDHNYGAWWHVLWVSSKMLLFLCGFGKKKKSSMKEFKIWFF